LIGLAIIIAGGLVYAVTANKEQDSGR